MSEKEKDNFKKTVNENKDNPVFTYSSLEKPKDGDYVFCLQWGAEKVGFGEFDFYFKDDQLCCSTEYMSSDFIKKALCAMVDSCTLIDQ